jgi:putative transcriptional regulator
MRERNKSTKESLAGALLLAHPSLRDPHFRRTVVLMSAHGPAGAMGVVLNRPLGRRLGELKGDFALGPLAGVPLCKGGPVEEKQLVLVAWQKREDGFRLHFGIEPEKATQLLDEESTALRAYVGFSSWGDGQLETELKQNTWVVTSAPTDLFSRPMDEALWRSLLAAEGAEWRLLADEPDEPEKN